MLITLQLLCYSLLSSSSSFGRDHNDIFATFVEQSNAYKMHGIVFLAVGGGDLTLTGGSERTVFKFQVEIEKLVATLLYEEQNANPLALAQIDDVRFNLSVHPNTLHLTTALGNLKAQDGQLPEVSNFIQLHSIQLSEDAKILQSPGWKRDWHFIVRPEGPKVVKHHRKQLHDFILCSER